MIKDEIIKEVRRGKDTVAAKYKHNVKAMAKALQDREKKSAANVVNLHDRRKTVSHPAKQ